MKRKTLWWVGVWAKSFLAQTTLLLHRRMSSGGSEAAVGGNYKSFPDQDKVLAVTWFYVLVLLMSRKIVTDSLSQNYSKASGPLMPSSFLAYPVLKASYLTYNPSHSHSHDRSYILLVDPI